MPKTGTVSASTQTDRELIKPKTKIFSSVSAQTDKTKTLSSVSVQTDGELMKSNPTIFDSL